MSTYTSTARAPRLESLVSKMRTSTNKLRLAVAVSTIAILSFLGAATPAAAQEVETPDWTQTQEWLRERGVDEATISSLTDKLNRGEFLDSLAEPDQWISKIDLPTGITRYTYADGSVSEVSALEDFGPTDSIPVSRAVNSITGCTDNSNSYQISYSNCHIKFDDGTLFLGFRSGYTRTSGSAVVSNWHTPYASAAYGSTSAAVFSYTKSSWSQASGPAQVQMHSRFTSWNGLSSEDLYLSLKVTPYGASVYNY